jgi:hypothetical protein
MGMLFRSPGEINLLTTYHLSTLLRDFPSMTGCDIGTVALLPRLACRVISTPHMYVFCRWFRLTGLVGGLLGGFGVAKGSAQPWNA